MRTQDFKVKDNVLRSDWLPDGSGNRNVKGSAKCETALYRSDITAKSAITTFLSLNCQLIEQEKNAGSMKQIIDV